MAQPEELLKETMAALDRRDGAVLESCVTNDVARRLERWAIELERHFRTVRRTIIHLVEDGARLGFLYRVLGEGAARVSWTGSGLARIRDGRIVELLIQEDAWAWKLRLRHSPRLPTDLVTGTWYGSVYSLPFYLRLDQRVEDPRFAGELETFVSEAAGFLAPRRTEVAGRNVHPVVALENADGDFRFEGRWTGFHRLEGRIALLPEPVVLRRLPHWVQDLPDELDPEILLRHSEP